MRGLPGAFLICSLALLAAGSPLHAEDHETRLALVIGNAHYKVAPLTTAANDAGLVAQTLQQAGFDVTEGADLGQEALRQALRGFVAKAQQAGPNAVLFVYLSGRGLQYAGENYFVPVDAVVQRETDVPLANVRLADYTKALANIPAKARIFVLDIARAPHFATEGNPFASGLALVDAEPGSLYAFNAAPGTIAPDEPGPYGDYAEALVEMMRSGAPLDQVFAATRLRVNQLTNGAVVPWDDSKIAAPLFFYVRDASAPPLPDWASLETQPLTGVPAAEAYALVIARDTLDGYEQFLAAYPRDPLALRVRALLAARREALTWFRAVEANTPEAYWTYMRRYKFGPHFADARRRLATLAAPLDPPPRFAPYDFAALPPPPEDEYLIVDQPVLIFNDPSYPPPPLPPASILPMRPVEFEHLPPPSQGKPGTLPIPAPIPLRESKPAQKPAIPPNVSQEGPSAPPPQVVSTPPTPAKKPVVETKAKKPDVHSPSPKPPVAKKIAPEKAQKTAEEKGTHPAALKHAAPIHRPVPKPPRRPKPRHPADH